MIDDLKPLGIASDYADLHRILRERADALNVSRMSIDEVAGLPVGYSAKLLQPIPEKALGAMSLNALLGALGLELVVCESPKVWGRVAARYLNRKENNVRATASSKPRNISEIMGLDYVRRALARPLIECDRESFIENRRKGGFARWRKRKPRVTGCEPAPSES